MTIPYSIFCRSLFRLRDGVRIEVIALVIPLVLCSSCRESPTAIDKAPVVQQNVNAEIAVSTPAELIAALSPENAGARILVRAGDSAIDGLLSIPDGVTLEGEGRMLYDAADLPSGFVPASRTTLRMNANIPGNFITLGDRVTIRNLEIADRAGRTGGNPVAALSRHPGDRVSATIVESVIVSPNPIGRTPDGPAGRGVLIGTTNRNLGALPGPDEDAVIDVNIVRSLLIAPAGGGGISAFNFAARGKISIALEGNVIEGPNDVNGGVSRPDAVHDAEIRVYSHVNLYRDGRTNPCLVPIAAWLVTGGSGPPFPITVTETADNIVNMTSVEDRIERFSIGVDAAGGRRFFAAPTAGPSTDNRVELQLLRGTVTTSPCTHATDFRLAGATVTALMVPGDSNSLTANFSGVTGSGLRSNTYSGASGPSAPLPSEFQGSGNRLTILGSPEAFAHANRQIDPIPPISYFSSRLE